MHPQCILGSELILWFGRSNLVPHRVDALELIDLLLRSGLLQDVGDDELAVSASTDEWELGNSFAAEQPRRRVFVLGGRGGGRRVEEFVKSGWMDKIGRFRSYARFFSWDGDLHRLACYESNSSDAQLMRTYWLDADTVVHALDSRLQSQQSAASSSSPGTDGKVAAAGVKFHFEIGFASQQSGESSLVLAVQSEQERRDWMRLLRLPFTETENAPAMPGQPQLQQKRDSKSGADVMQGLSLRTPALPPSFSFAADVAGFPSASLNPTAFAHPALLHPPSLTSPGDADSEDALHERSMPELQREQLRLSEFAVSRAKSAMWLQSAMTAMEAKAELDLGLVDILNDYDDADEQAEAAAAAAAASSEGEEEQPGLTQQTPLKTRRAGAGQRLQAVAEERGEGEDDDTDAVYDFEEEDEEDAAEDDAAEDDDDIDPGQLAFPSSSTRSLPQDDAYSASRKQQRRRKTLRAIDRITALLREEASPLGRLLSVFIKLFRSLYSHALDMETDGKQAAATAAVGLSPYTASLYSSLSFQGAAAPTFPSRTQSMSQDRTPPSSSPHQSSSSLSSPSVSFSPFSSSGLPSSASPSLSYYALYPRHVRHVLKSAKEDVDCFLLQLLRLVSAHLQPDPFQSDPRLQSLLSSSSSSAQLVQYVPSQQYIAGAKANSVLAPIQSVGSASASASSSGSPSSPLQRALLLREKNRDVASMLAGCRRALQRHVFAAVSDVLLPIYAVKHAQRDREAEARMTTMRDVDWERFGLSPELLLPGMRRREEERKEGAGEEEGESSSSRAPGGGGLLTDEFNAAHEEREEEGGGEAGAPAASELDTSFMPLELSMSLPGSSASASAESAASAPGSAAAPYHHAVKQLQALSGIADPYDKLSCVLRVARAICRSVDDARERQAVVINADDLLLLFAFLIITVSNNRAAAAADAASASASSTLSPSSSSPSSSPPLCAWHAHLSMMDDYLTDKQRCMLRGYYLATIQAALELIMTTELRPAQQQQQQISATAELEGSPSTLQLSPSDSISSSTSSSSFSSQGSLDGGGGGGGGTPEEDCGELVVIVQ